MAVCSRDFFVFFSENMEALGLPAPKSLFSSAQTATSTIATILGTMKSLGATASRMTLRELLGAAGALEGTELLAIAGAAYASYYVGAAIGSLLIATQRTAMCGQTIADYIAEMDKHPRLEVPAWLRAKLQHSPEVFLWQNPGRQAAYAHKAFAR